MARKPKPTRPVEAPATIAEPELPMLGKALAPVRRGRPPKPADTPPPSSAAEDDSEAVADIVEAGDDMASDTEADAPDTPSKRRQGRKPKPSGGVAVVSLSRDKSRHAKGQRGRKPDDAAPAAEPEDAAPPAEAVDEDGPTAGSDANARDAAEAKPADEAAPSPVVPRPKASSKSAAYWDQATDTVRFDWPEIERTASRDGPNQAMAKLLVAARAEGAHSRWPL